MRPIQKRIRCWRRRQDHFDWFSSYLRARRMGTTTRGVLAAVTLALACVPLGMLGSSAPPDGTAGTVLAILAGVCGTAAAVLWVARFPTKNQSIVYSLTCSASIAAAALAQSDPLTALVACTAFATISGYIALFHTPVLMAANLVVILGASIVPAVRFATMNGVVWAACVYGVVLIVNVAVPFAVQIIVYTLGVDVVEADRDPLTGLYTRRAFYRRTRSLAAGHRGDAHLIMAMIDLDRFKQLNDTRGHTEGDQVLAAVGRTLREKTRPGAVVGRAGGEEFLVADVFDDPRLGPVGQRLCNAVAALPDRITASVGIASIRCDEILDRDDHTAITALVGAADAAMYVAKRNGGNQIRHRRRPLNHQDPPGGKARLWNPTYKRWERASPHPGPPAARTAAPRHTDASGDSTGDHTDTTSPITVVPVAHGPPRFRHDRDVRTTPVAPRHPAVAKHRRHLASIHRLTWCYRGVGMKKVPPELG